MASIRNLKKDIDYIIREVISDAQLFLYFHPKKKENEVYTIIEEAFTVRDELYARVNTPDGKYDKKLTKQHYTAIRKDLITLSYKLFDRISTLNK